MKGSFCPCQPGWVRRFLASKKSAADFFPSPGVYAWVKGSIRSVAPFRGLTAPGNGFEAP